MPLKSVAVEKNSGLYISEYPGSFSVSLPIYLLDYLSAKLTDEFGKGFDKSNLRKMRQFYCTFPIRDTLCLELGWSHYRLLMRIPDEQARTFYMEECVKSAWSVRQLEWQINTMYYQRMNKSNRVSEFSRHPVTLSHNRRCHSRKRQIKGRVDRCEKIVVERIEMFHHY